MNSGPGLINSSCCPTGTMIGEVSQGRAGIGSLSSRAPTVVEIDVCTNRPDSAMIGPWPQAISIGRVRLLAASAGAIGFPSAPSTATSASPGGFSWSKPIAVRSITSSQSSRLIRIVSVTCGRSATVRGPALLGFEPAGLRAIAEVDGDHLRMSRQRRRAGG